MTCSSSTKGSHCIAQELFCQHWYRTAFAKTMASLVLSIEFVRVTELSCLQIIRQDHQSGRVRMDCKASKFFALLKIAQSFTKLRMTLLFRQYSTRVDQFYSPLTDSRRDSRTVVRFRSEKQMSSLVYLMLLLLDCCSHAHQH